MTQLLPGARVLRWDADTTSQKGAHDLILSHFSAHRADILIGTQMLAKGLDLPLVTLVGIILAEVGLNLPDYRAAERTFQVLTQVAGRAGRSPLGGQVIMQTYTPENYAIQAASRQDYAGFYTQELNLRQELAYPPFTRLVRMEYRHADNERADITAQQMAESLRTWIKEGGLTQTDFIGPVPCFYTRLNGQYRWQIVLRGPDPVQLKGKKLSRLDHRGSPPRPVVNTLITRHRDSLSAIYYPWLFSKDKAHQAYAGFKGNLLRRPSPALPPKEGGTIVQRTHISQFFSGSAVQVGDLVFQLQATAS